MRNVTFVLQKNKKHIDGFDGWYQNWQIAMSADPIMKWCISARNYLVKEGDLETLSTAQVTLLNSHNEAKKYIFTADPILTGSEIARLVKEEYLPEQLSEYGYLQVIRQWITKDLEEIELLSGLAHAFTVLKLLVDDIEKNAGPGQVYKSKKLSVNEFVGALDFLSEDDKLPCMLAFEEYRTTNYNLGTGEVVDIRTHVVELCEEDIPGTEERYGHIKEDIGVMGRSLYDRVNYHLKIAKGVLNVDGYLLTTVAIFDSSDKPHMISTAFRDNEDKYLFWKDIAKRIKKLRAKMIITVGDTWIAKLDKSEVLKPGQRVADMKDKGEALLVVGMDRNGEIISINTPYTREREIIHFGDSIEDNVQPNYLNPVAKAFKRLKYQ